jgi:hypothetical protein
MTEVAVLLVRSGPENVEKSAFGFNGVRLKIKERNQICLENNFFEVAERAKQRENRTSLQFPTKLPEH